MGHPVYVFFQPDYKELFEEIEDYLRNGVMGFLVQDATDTANEMIREHRREDCNKLAIQGGMVEFFLPRHSLSQEGFKAIAHRYSIHNMYRYAPKNVPPSHQQKV